jgi:glycogen synthase
MTKAEGRIAHVLMTADAVGGVWTYALELAAQLGRLGVHTTLATMGPPLRADQRKAVSRIPGLAVIESDFKLEWMEDPWFDVALAGKWLLDLERSLSPDVVHLNGYAHASLPWRTPRLVVAHSCVLSRWQAVVGSDAPPKYRRYREAVAAGLSAADAVVAPTQAILDRLRAHYGAPSTAVVIRNGIDLRRCRPAKKQALVFSAGRLWDDANNIAALASVAGQLPWPVCVAGDDRHPDGSVRRRGEGVRTLGPIPPAEARAWMARASIYALPARYEPFGLSILEAAAHGCALVLGDIESLRELWGPYAAEYVPAEEPEALRTALGHLMADRPLRVRRGRAARERARSMSIDRSAAAYLDLYDRLSARRRVPTSEASCA